MVATEQQQPTATVDVRGRLPLLGNAVPLLANPLKYVQHLRSYGELARIHVGPKPVYVVNSPELIHQMLVIDARKYDKGRLFDKVRDALGNGLPVSDGDFHKKQRRLMQPAFHHERIARYTELMSEIANATANSWQPDQIVELREEMNDLILRIVVKTMFSAELGEKARTTILDSLPTVLQGIGRRTVLPSDLLEKLPTPSNRRYESARADLHREVDEIVKTYRTDGLDHGDLLSMLIRARDQETGETMTDREAADEIMLTIVAGSESSALTLSWLFYELMKNPQIMQRIQHEVDTVLDGRPCGFADLPALSYTRQALTESLRMHCPIWIVMRRTTTEVRLGGHQLPAGAEMLFSPYSLHRDPDLYPNPMIFDPDRWANGMKSLPPGAFVPFAAGRRKCVGDSFAWAQMAISVAAIISRWEMRAAPGHVVREKAQAMVSPDRLPVIVTPRKHS